MEDLLKFLIRKKASVVYRMKEGDIRDASWLFRFILLQTSKQKPIVSRILPDSMVKEFNEKTFLRLKPSFGNYVIGDAACDLYIPQSINHCLLLKDQIVDNRLFDITVEFDDAHRPISIYFGDELLSYDCIPSALARRLAEKTKVLPEKIVNELKKIPRNDTDKLFNYLAKSDACVSFISLDGGKAATLVMDFMKKMNGYIHVYPLNKNDATRFINTDFSILTDFYITRVVSKNEDYSGKIVIPMFDVGKYKNVVVRKDFVYVGYSCSEKTVPNSSVTVYVSNNIPVSLKTSNCTIMFDGTSFHTEGDFSKFLDTYKTPFNSSMFHMF